MSTSPPPRLAATSRLAGLDAVRFAATLMVVVSHVGPTHGLSFTRPE
jgi:peptidoglycan/LPS O-acetylase OafA/YrhL